MSSKRYYSLSLNQVQTEDQIRASYPNTIFPTPFEAPPDWILLVPAPTLPEYEPLTSFLTDGTPTLLESGEYQENKYVATYPPSTQAQLLAEASQGFLTHVEQSIQDLYKEHVGNSSVERDLAYQEAKQWVSITYLGNAPSTVASFAATQGMSNADAADFIVANGDLWYSFVRMVREARTKVLLMPRTTVVEFRAAEAFWNGVLEIGLRYKPVSDLTLTEMRAHIGPPPPTPELNQYDSDKLRLLKRAQVVPLLLAGMGADNLAQVREGNMTIMDLYALNSHPVTAEISKLVQLQSFEMAATALAQADLPMLPVELKNKWIQDLQSHFYN